jgi:hypothetical protein
MASKSPADIEDFLVVEDLDLGDESELRRVVAEVETFVKAGGKGLRVSVLTTDQWKTVIVRMLPDQMRRGAERYIHTLRDPRDPQHLLVSPSAVRGINERQRGMYHEVVFALLRCLPSDLRGPLRKGLDDVIAEECSDKVGVDLFARNYPREATLVRGLVQVLRQQFGHRDIEWALEMRRNPDRFFMALRKSRFIKVWLECAREDDNLAAELKGRKNATAVLIKLLSDPDMSSDDPIFTTTERALILHAQKLKEPKDG